MADEPTEHTDEQSLEPADQSAESPVDSQESSAAAPLAEEPVAGVADTPRPEAEEAVVEKPPVEEPVAKESVSDGPMAEEIVAAVEKTPAQETAAEKPAAEEPTAEAPAATEPAAEEDEAEEEEPAPRVKPSVPGAHLEVDIVPEGVDPLAPDQPADPYALDDEEEEPKSEEDTEGSRLAEPISSAAIDLAAGARYKATGKRKTAIARVILRPGSGTYLVNGRALDEHFPRVTLQRNIRQPLETVGYQERMDVVARLHGGGISAQAGALRHGISRALLEADPNLRGELKRRGFLTRDSRAKERKKAGLKKARKRPQFSKR
jgi:small subunit ribosomal protein S9